MAVVSRSRDEMKGEEVNECPVNQKGGDRRTSKANRAIRPPHQYESYEHAGPYEVEGQLNPDASKRLEHFDRRSGDALYRVGADHETECECRGCTLKSIKSHDRR